MQEFMLPAVLIGVIALGSTMTLVNSGLFDQFIQRQFHGSITNRVLELRSGSSLAISPSAKTYPSSQDVALILKNRDGQTVKVIINDYSGNLAESIEINGTDGTTRHHAAMLKAMAKSLLDQGVIDEAQANDIIELAKKGFILADQHEAIRKGFEKVDNSGYRDFASLKSSEEKWDEHLKRTYYFNNIRVVDSQGKPTNLSELVQRVSFYGPKINEIPGGVTSNNIPPNAGLDMAEFMKQYQKLESSGALSQAPLKQLMASLVGQIAISGELVESKIFQNEMRETIAKDTQAQSGNICNLGNGDVIASGQESSLTCY
jgi:hypothetical protein